MRTSLNQRTPCPKDFEQRVIVALTSCWEQDRLDTAYSRACMEIRHCEHEECNNIHCSSLKRWTENMERVYDHVRKGINTSGVSKRTPTTALDELLFLRDYEKNPYATAKILRLFMNPDGETYKPWYMRFLHKQRTGYCKEPCLRDRLKMQEERRPKKITRTTEIIEY